MIGMGFSRSRVGLKWDVDAMYSSHQYVLVCLKFWDTNGQFKGEHDDQPSWIWGVHNGNMRMLSKRTAPGVHAAVFDDDGGGRHPGLHRAIRHTLQAAEIGRAMAMAILVYQDGRSNFAGLDLDLVG